MSEHETEKHVSGDWGACDACYKLIEADNFNGLIMRAIDEQKISDNMREEMYDCLTELYNMFKEHRIGSVIRE